MYLILSSTSAYYLIVGRGIFSKRSLTGGRKNRSIYLSGIDILLYWIGLLVVIREMPATIV